MNDFKPGDRVTYVHAPPSSAWKVVAVHGDWVWALQEGHSDPISIRALALKPAPGPFFEVGKTYTRWTDWSIWAQRHNVTEEFTVLDVRQNSNGGRVAFGRMRITGDFGENGKLAERYLTLGEHHYRSEEWKDAL